MRQQFEISRRLTMTVPEAGEILGLGRTAAYEAARTGQLPTLRIGHRLLVPLGAMEKMLSVRPGTLSKANLTGNLDPEYGRTHSRNNDERSEEQKDGVGTKGPP